MVSNIVLNYIPFRNSLYFMTTGKENFSTKFNIICTICFQVATCSVSIVFPNVSNVLAIFGGIASVNIVYIVPCKFCFYVFFFCQAQPKLAQDFFLSFITLIFCLSISVLLLELRHEGDPLTSCKNMSAIIYFSMMCLIGWGSSIGTVLMMLGSDTNAFLYCQTNQQICPALTV